jgi:hypothetical protein
MNPLVKPCKAQTVEAGLTVAEPQACLMTTLYDAMAALHTIVEPDEDNLVVAVVVQWLRSGRLTFVRDVTVAA